MATDHDNLEPLDPETAVNSLTDHKSMTLPVTSSSLKIGPALSIQCLSTYRSRRLSLALLATAIALADGVSAVGTAR